jgi:cytochrome c553
MIGWWVSVLGGVFLAGAGLAEGLPNGEPNEGRKLAGQCRTCHGLDGLSRIPIAPHIGGEPAEYLTAQLIAFRDGSREHEMMTVVARGLTDQAIADLSAWYSQHKVQAELGADPERAPEQCVACHGADGISLIEDAPNLAAESVIYLDTQLKAFRSGKRTHEIMSPIASELTDEEIRAVSEWYAGVALTITMPEK